MTTAGQWAKAAAAVRRQMEERGIVEVESFGGWKKGDLVSVRGESGVFTFLSVRLLSNGEPSHVNVWGGPSKQEMLRSFPVERLEKFTSIKRRRRKIVQVVDG